MRNRGRIRTWSIWVLLLGLPLAAVLIILLDQFHPSVTGSFSVVETKFIRARSLSVPLTGVFKAPGTGLMVAPEEDSMEITILMKSERRSFFWHISKGVPTNSVVTIDYYFTSSGGLRVLRINEAEGSNKV